MFDDYCLGVDVSYYQTDIDWPVLYAAGLRFAILRSSLGNYLRDLAFNRHLQGAQQAGMICGVYHYLEMNCSAGSQMENLKAVIDGKDFSFLALDVEQYWRNWAANLRAEAGNRHSPQHISQLSLEMALKMREVFQKPVLIYSRASFIQEYAPLMSEWLPAWPLWLAHYPYSKEKVTLTWQELKSKFFPAIPGPWLPRKCSDWKFWQFSGDKFTLPGVTGSCLDLNFFHGNLLDLQAWLGLPQTPRQFSLEERVSRLWLAHPNLWQEESNDEQKSTIAAA
jgi:lysozyme